MAEQRKYPRWLLIGLLAGLAGGALLLGGRLIRDRIQRAGGVPLDDRRREELREKLDYNPRSIFIYDPRISYRLKPRFRGIRHDSPGHLHLTDSRGILGGEEVDPDTAVGRILLLGDSVAYGSHVPFEEIFITRMDRDAGGAGRFLNASCPGWSTHQELGFYQDHLADLPLNLVVIVFTINDLLRFEWVWRDDQSFQMSAETRGLGGLAESRRTDWELGLLRNRFRSNPALQPLADLNNTCLHAYLDRSWSRFREDVEPALRALAEKRAVILAPVPARPQLESLNRGGDPEPVLFPQRKLEELAREWGIEYLDLLPAFQAADGSYDENLFLAGERGTLHLSAEGHRRLADWLQPRLLERMEP